MAEHRDLIVEQFTRQAVPFSTAPGVRDEEALRLLVELAGARPEDTLLDVACGPGLVVCAFAEVVQHATGIDVTPAMIERARALAEEKGLRNVGWRVGDVLPLPYPDAAFSLVTSRFAFHHFIDPRLVLAEMVRVCAPDGRIVLVDVVASADPAKAAAFNRMEKLRNPSHVRALTLAEQTALFAAAGLEAPRAGFYELRADLEGLLERSFPAPGDADRIRLMFLDSLDDDGLGMGTRRHGDRIVFAYPVAILVAPRSTSAAASPPRTQSGMPTPR
jgi:SAM-dependent methyltransferase